MRTLTILFLFLSISIPAAAGILPPEHREQLIQAAFANFWGKARLSNGNPVQPDNAAERSTLPISTAAANHVISAGELSGIAEWCGMDWQTHFLSLTAKARRQGFSEKQVAFIGLLHGMAQGNVYSAVQSKSCTVEQKSKAAQMLETSPVKQEIPQ
ncbi:hypothetical protein [Roseateles sp. LYH14W]|uniref:Uncharacterized protein n=1 Tax=Pelomonas parva TaxID=3299032 RepID=A0ABW7F1S8_9BURK